MRKICYLYFIVQKAIVHKIWIIYCEKFLFLTADHPNLALNCADLYNRINRDFVLAYKLNTMRGALDEEENFTNYTHSGTLCISDY